MRISLMFVAGCSLVAGFCFAQGEWFGSIVCLAGAAINFRNLWRDLPTVSSEAKKES